MKKITLFSIFALSVFMLFGQSQRLTLIEHFTQASCPYCPPGNVHVDEIIENNADKAIVLRYQVWWPGYDPMYFHNPEDVNTRVSYYSINAVPGTVYEGINLEQNYYGYLTDEVVENHYAIPSPFDIDVDHTISQNNDSIYLTVDIKATQAVSGNLTAQIVVVERHIAFEEAPGSNGEKNFYNVMKKMFPDAEGTTLPASMAIDDNETMTFSWKLENVYNVNELAVIAFVQNESTHEILQTGFSDKKPANAEFDRDISVVSASNLPPSVCGDEASISPLITFTNFGAVSCTSIEFKYKINNGEENTFVWTGGIRHTETRETQLDPIFFTPEETNTLYIYATSLNGEEDENNSNDTLALEIQNSVEVNKKVTLELMTDSKPHEIFWKFFHIDDLVNPIARSTSYNASHANTLITETIELTKDGCHQFVIQDINGLEEGAYYKLYDSNGTLIFEGGNFVRKETVPFKASLDLTAEKLNNISELEVFPNPAKNTFNIRKTTNNNLSNFTIYNALGKEIYTMENIEREVFSIDVSTWEQGFYFIHFSTNNKQYVEKIIINR